MSKNKWRESVLGGYGYVIEHYHWCELVEAIAEIQDYLGIEREPLEKPIKHFSEYPEEYQRKVGWIK